MSGEVHASLITFLHLLNITHSVDYDPVGMLSAPGLHPGPRETLALALTLLTAASHPQYLDWDLLPPGKLPASVNRAFVWIPPHPALGLIFHGVGAAPRLKLLAPPASLSAGCQVAGGVPRSLWTTVPLSPHCAAWTEDPVVW